MDNFFARMAPYAARAAAALGIDTGVVLAQWANESARGTSVLARSANNFAGINHSPNSIAAGSDGVFASYSSIDQFTDDYIRVMNLSYYDTVRAAGKSGDVSGTIRALGASPWAQSHYGTNAAGQPGQNLNDIYYQDHLGQYSGMSLTPPAADNAKALAIGLAFLALIAMAQQK